MNKTGVALLLVLLLQVAVTAKLYLGPDNGRGENPGPPLTQAPYYSVDGLRIEDSQGNRVQLQRTGGRWVIPGLEDLPADEARIARVLQPLQAQDHGWIVADTLAARQRFQVAPYHYRRKLTLMAQGETIDTLFLGTSPSFRKVHVRNSSSDAIYSIDLNLFDLPIQAGQWLTPGLLRVKAPVQIVADGYALDRSSGEWLLGTGETPDPVELDALLQALAHLQIAGVASSGEAGEAELILQIESLEGAIELALFQRQGKHLIRSSRYPFLFEISSYTFNQLADIALLPPVSP